MVLEKIRERIKPAREETADDFVELDASHFSEKNQISVRVDNLNSFADTARVQDLLRDGNVVFLNIKDLRERDINELKRAVDKLRKTVSANNGDIVGVDEDFMILTPSFARIYRGSVI